MVVVQDEENRRTRATRGEDSESDGFPASLVPVAGNPGYARRACSTSVDASSTTPRISGVPATGTSGED